MFETFPFVSYTTWDTAQGMLRMLSRGITSKDFAENLGVSISFVNKFIAELGLGMNSVGCSYYHRSRNQLKWDRFWQKQGFKHEKEALELFYRDHSQRQIAEFTNTTQNRVDRRLKTYNLKTRGKGGRNNTRKRKKQKQMQRFHPDFERWNKLLEE